MPPPAEPPAPDPRIAEASAKLSIDHLPVAGPTAAPLGPEPLVLLDDDRPGILWADAATPVASVKRAPTAIAVRAGSEVRMASAAVLGDARCATWLALTKATLGDVAHADNTDFVRDPTLCGASATARLQTLQTAQGTLFLRTRDAEPTCERLRFTGQQLVRDGSAPDRPTLAFGVAIGDEALDVAGPLGTPAKGTVAVSCNMEYTLTGDTRTSFQLVYPRPRAPYPRVDAMYISEAACLAAWPAETHATDCLRSLLAATSTAKDVVIDRIAPLVAHGAPVFRLDGTTCSPVVFNKTIGERNTQYYGSCVETLQTGNDFHNSAEPVVQTTGDFVWVGDEKWFLSQAACQHAATSR